MSSAKDKDNENNENDEGYTELPDTELPEDTTPTLPGPVSGNPPPLVKGGAVAGAGASSSKAKAAAANAAAPATTTTTTKTGREDEGEGEEDEVPGQNADADAAYEAKFGGDKGKPMLSGNDFAAVRALLGMHNPIELYYEKHYKPNGPYASKTTFSLSMPTDEYQILLSPADPQKALYTVGKQISKQECDDMTNHYHAFRAMASGRPLIDPEEAKRRAEAIQKLVAIRDADKAAAPRLGVVGGTAGGRGKGQLAATTAADTTTITTAKPHQPQPKAESAEVEHSQQVVQYKDDRYPLAAYLMTELAGDTIAAKEISTAAVAMVLSKVRNLDGELIDLLKNKSTHPHEFAALVINEMKDMLKSMDPNILDKLDIAHMHLVNWQQHALAIQFDAEEQMRHKQGAIDALVKRLDLCERMLPEHVRLQYHQAEGLIDAYPQLAEMKALQAEQADQAIAAATATATTKSQGQDQPNGGPARRRFGDKIRDLKEMENKLKAINSGQGLPIDRDVRVAMNTGEKNAEFIRKYHEWAQNNPEAMRKAQEFVDSMHREEGSLR